jgi:hypothetical protein
LYSNATPPEAAGWERRHGLRAWCRKNRHLRGKAGL